VGVVSSLSTRAPTDYTTYYRENTGQTINVWSLLAQMLERFVETDPEFLAWRRRPAAGRACRGQWGTRLRGSHWATAARSAAASMSDGQRRTV
jgi:hypothetical protein